MRVPAIHTWLICTCLFPVQQGCVSTVEAPVLSRSEESSAAGIIATTRSDYHTVIRGDTLYSIAWRYSLDYRKVAAWNHISPPYTIYPGQKIHLQEAPVDTRGQAKKSLPETPASRQVPAAGGVKTAAPPGSPVAPGRDIQWRWPTQGKLVKLSSPTLQKGLNITGTTGQAILAAAGGDVVYSGSGLLGYGKLIIIKHNEVYLSAYAHNEELLVREGMRVSSGQKIATMGKDSNQRPLLHFEIRREGKPVDPLKHLPEQQS